MKTSITSKTKNALIKISAVAFWIIVWEALAVFIHSDLIIASPVQTLKTLASMVKDPSFWGSLQFSLIRIFGGFLAALSLGTAAAAASSRFGIVKALLSPITSVIKSTPVASFIILAIMWFGSRNLSVFISFLMVFPVIYLNLLKGIESFDPELSEMASVFGIKRAKRFVYIYLLQIMPFLKSACSVALGLCWKSGIAAEVIGISKGSVGERLYRAKLYFETGELLAWTAVIILLSAGIEKIVMAGISAMQRKIEGSFSENCVRKAESEKQNGSGRRYIPSPSAIELCGISKSYNGQQVLKDLTLLIAPEQKLSVKGRSGAGKTTLSRLIMGLETPDGGKITPAKSNRITAVFQEDRLINSVNAVCNIAIAGCKNISEAVALLYDLGLTGELIFKPCGELSGGERRRVAIARALLCPGDVIIMDEPFKGIDSDTLFGAVIPQAKRLTEGKTVVLITHSDEEAKSLCLSEISLQTELQG